MRKLRRRCAPAHRQASVCCRGSQHNTAERAHTHAHPEVRHLVVSVLRHLFAAAGVSTNHARPGTRAPLTPEGPRTTDELTSIGRACTDLIVLMRSRNECSLPSSTLNRAQD